MSDRAEAEPATGVLLAPGAGSSAEHASLRALEARLAGPGRVVRRMDFPYRRAGRRAPDREPVLLQAIADEAALLGPVARLVLGGRSMGGRMCSLAAAKGLLPAPVVGLVLIAYPLHPPGKPDRLRVVHFPDLDVPCLFVSGTRDAFATPEELTHHSATIPGAVTHAWIEGATHELKRRDDQVAELSAAWVESLLSSAASA